MAISQKDVQVEDGDPGAPSGGAGGAGQDDKVWTVSGRLTVRESELEGTSHDRPLAGIEVKVQASDLSGSGPWTTWGVARTDADGDFGVTEENNGRTRFFRVQARLVAPDLTVEDGSLIDIGHLDIADRNWRTVWKSNGQLSGPGVGIGTRVVASGQPEELGDGYFRRQAMIWYTLRTILDRLEDEDEWFAIDGQVKVLYPARSGIAATYRNGLNIHLQIDTDAWEPPTMLWHFWEAWHDTHSTGTGKITQGWPSERFSGGFAAFARMAILHELWGGRLEKPLNRRYLAAGLEISTLNELEDTTDGVQDALWLLRFGERAGWWSHLFGTAQEFPAGRPDDDGDGEPDYPGEVGVKHRLGGLQLPDEPHHLSLWDILSSFRADPSSGWDDDLALESGENGLLAFIARVADIHGLSDDTRSMLLDALDPLATKEPYEWLPKARR